MPDRRAANGSARQLTTNRGHLRLPAQRVRLSGSHCNDPPADVQRTLLELTAASVANALLAHQATTQRLLVCGGGVHNPLLRSRLAARLPGVIVESTADHGVDPDFIEAMGFAWLARETLAGRPGNLPAVTGALGPRILGAIHLA